jgi:hypothetical protein
MLHVDLIIKKMPKFRIVFYHFSTVIYIIKKVLGGLPFIAIVAMLLQVPSP